MLSNIFKLHSLSSRVNPSLICRHMASAQATDPIQKLFVDKIREYNAKAKSSDSVIVDATPQTKQEFKEVMERVARTYSISDENKITELDIKFPNETPIDSINMKHD